MRSGLVTALATCACSHERQGVHDFLLGLSWDELEYIAEFVGSTILDSVVRSSHSREQLAGRIAEFELSRRACRRASSEMLGDQYHKMIVLMEFLCRTGPRDEPMALHAG